MTDLITEEQLARVHPLAAALIEHLDVQGLGPASRLTEDEVTELRTGLETLYGHEELREAVRCLLNLGAHLQQTGVTHASKQLLDLVEEPPVLDALDALNEARQAESEATVQKASDELRKLSGDAGGKKAPQVGEKKPDGALSLDQLKFPKRL